VHFNPTEEKILQELDFVDLVILRRKNQLYASYTGLGDSSSKQRTMLAVNISKWTVPYKVEKVDMVPYEHVQVAPVS
jgi:hypothetical protein